MLRQPLTRKKLDLLRMRAQNAIQRRLPEDEPDTIPNWCYDVIIATVYGAYEQEIAALLRAGDRENEAMQSAADFTWRGFTLFYRGRKAMVERSHGNWLATAYDKRGQLSSGEYFSYGRPGALDEAKRWCEARLAIAHKLRVSISGKRKRR